MKGYVNPFLYPKPRSLTLSGGDFSPINGVKLLVDRRGDTSIDFTLNRFVERYALYTGKTVYPLPDRAGKYIPGLLFTRCEALTGESYEISVTSERAEVRFGTAESLFRATTTLLQLFRGGNGSVPCMEIKDSPDLAKRGYMFDISRGKQPHMSELYKLVDLLAELKYNEFQLYIEAIVYAYPDFPEYLKDREPYSPYDIMRLAAYCRDRFIRLIPNQNSFGHMTAWCRQPEIKPFTLDASALDPLDPRSIEFVNRIYDDVLPAYGADTLNAGCDEVFNIANSPKTKALSDEIGEGRVYADFIVKLHDLLQSKGVRMQFWADIILNHSELLPLLPKDIIPLIWNYEAEIDFEPMCKKVEATGLEYYVCPGTATWCTDLGDEAKAFANISNAAECALKHGGKGLLLTDWGDAGHTAFILHAYSPIIYAAGVSWSLNTCSSYQSAHEFADAFVFETRNGSFASLIHEASTLTPKAGNCTPQYLTMLFSFDRDSCCCYYSAEHIAEAEKKLTCICDKVSRLSLGCSDGELCIKEFLCNAHHYTFINKIYLIKQEKTLTGKVENFKSRLEALKKEETELRKEHISLWIKRNRFTGSERYFDYIKNCFTEMEKACKDDK